MSVHWRAQWHESVPRKMAEARQSVSAIIRNRTRVAKLTASHLNHWAIDLYKMLEKNGIWLVVFRHLQPIFCVQDCCTWIFQVEYQGQTQNTRILERKPLIDTSYRIRHVTSHNFCSMLIKQLIDLEKVRTDNLKFRTDLRDWVMDGWSVTQ